MERWEIEARLNQDRAWLLETYAAMTDEERSRPATESQHEAGTTWSALDHLAHLSGIETDFNRMIRRHVAGDRNPVGLMTNEDGSARTREEIMVGVHAFTEGWANEHRGKSFSEIVALGQRVRADTLALLAELTDEQLAEKLPGAPWADGTVGGVMAVHADHGRGHFGWVKEGWATRYG